LKVPESQVTIMVYTRVGKGERKKIFEKTYGLNQIREITNDVSSFLRKYPAHVDIVLRKSPVLLVAPQATIRRADVSTEEAKVSRSPSVLVPLARTASESIISKSPATLKQPKATFPMPSSSERLLRRSADATMASAMPSLSIPHERKELKLISLGGCYGIEASSHILLIDGHCLLLDAGYNEKRPLRLEVLKTHKPEAMFVTHAHLDHVGSLPILHRKFPNIPIYMTPPTKALASTILYDAMNVASLRKINLYTQEEIGKTLDHVVTIDFDQEFDFKDLKVVFRCAGHVLGAAYIMIEGNSKVLYTGDFSSSAFLATPPSYIPDTPEVIDLLITESTYGASQHSVREKEVEDFCAKVKNVIQRGGRVLIPSFALGRAQEVLTILLKQIEEGRLERVPVILDGMARTVAAQYDEYSDYLPSELYRTCRRSTCLRPVGDSQNRERAINNSAPCIIIASSGMLTGGPSVAYAEKILSEDKSAILIVGYLDEEAPGRQIANSEIGKPIELMLEDGKGGTTKVTVLRGCEVQEYKLSAHSDQQGLVNFVAYWQPLATVLVHGETRAKMALAKAILESCCDTVIISENGEEIDADQLIHLWGEIKLAQAHGMKADVNENCERFVDEAHAKSSDLTFDVFKDILAKTELLAHCGSLTKAKDTAYRLFAWSLKHAQTSKGLDFNFPALVFSNGAMLIRVLFGRRFEKKFLSQFQRSLPGMFKNLVMFGGPHITRGELTVYIESKGQLSFAVESFEKNFGKLEIHAPELSSIQESCESWVQKTSDSTSRERFTKVFVEEARVEISAPLRLTPPTQEKAKAPPTLEEKHPPVPPPVVIPKRLRSGRRRAVKRKEIITPVIPDGLIGVGRQFKTATPESEPKSKQPVLEVRETFTTAEPACIFCGSTKLKLLKVTSVDAKTHRREYSCEDCKRVYAVRSPNL